MSLLRRISLLKSSSERLKKSTITLREGEICLVDTKGEGYDSLIIGDGNTQAKDLPLFSLSAGVFMGEATPETDLSTISGDSYYFTKTPGKYLGGSIEVREGEVAFLIYKYKGWKKETILTVDQEITENSTNPVSGAAVAKALKNKISEIEISGQVLKGERVVIPVDKELSVDSKNPVMNKTVTNKFSEIEDWYNGN